MRDATATLIDQMSCRQLPDGLIVHPYETGLHSGDRAIDQNKRNFPLLHISESPCTGLSRGHNQPVNLPGQQRLRFVSFQLGAFLEIRNDDVISMRSDSLGYCFGDFREKRMSEVGQQQSDGKSAPCHQTACNPVGLIVQGLGPPQDPGPRGGADLALITQDLGDGNDRNSYVLRDVLHGDSHGREGYHLLPDRHIVDVGASVPHVML